MEADPVQSHELPHRCRTWLGFMGSRHFG